MLARPITALHRLFPLLGILATILLTITETGAVDSENTDDEESAEEGAEKQKADHGYAEIEKLAQAIETIRQNYVEAEGATYENLIDGALEGMFASLDPHCEYMRARVFEQMKRSTGSTYDGVGITISVKDGSIAIVNVREDGAAARAGVMPGDQIISIGEQQTARVGLAEALGLLDGKPGEPITLTLLRGSTGEVLKFEMVREIIQKDSVRDITLLPANLTGEKNIGYLRILQFNGPTADEFAEALDSLEDQGMEGLVLDLRNNPGGLLDSAVDICSEFLPEETVVVTTKGRNGSEDSPPYRTGNRGGRPQRSFPVAILINVGSASASEIVAGALQDLKRALVVGETSFGKGSVQSVIPMQGGGAMRLTTARYYTPSLKVIHEVGVTPNIIVPLTPEKERALMKWRSQAHDKNTVAGEIGALEDRQLERAVDALRGVLVLSSETQ